MTFISCQSSFLLLFFTKYVFLGVSSDLSLKSILMFSFSPGCKLFSSTDSLAWLFIVFMGLMSVLRKLSSAVDTP